MDKGDVGAVVEVERRSFDAPWTPGQFRHELKVPFSRTVVAWSDEPDPPRVAGYICRWLVGDEVSILNVAVDPDFRRRGLGRSLVASIVEEAHATNAAIVLLEVRENNAAARFLYASLGFTESGVRRNYYGKSEHAIIMRKELANRSPGEEGLCPNLGGGV